MNSQDAMAAAAGIGLIALGVLGIAGLAWNLRRGVQGYFEAVHARFGKHVRDKRSVWFLTYSKLAISAFVVVILLVGGGILLGLSARP